MASLLAFVILIVATVLIDALTLALSAKLIGSVRATFRAGLFVATILMAVNLCIVFALMLVSGQSTLAKALYSVIVLAAQLVVAVLLIRRAFALSVKRTLIPIAALIGISVVQMLGAQFLFRPYVAEAFEFPTRSMLPTIAPADRFFVNKMLSPRRWDLVAYWSRSDGDVIYCKRLVGLPGEKLKFDDGKMYVNDQVVEAPEVVAGKYYAAPPGLLPSQARYHDGETIELKGDEYFLIGDNVDVSADSRVYGPTLRSDLVGVADFIYWPLNRIKLLR